jgi:hypothetical protein
MPAFKPYIANLPIHFATKEVKGFLTEVDGESVYCIENYNHMDPFFMSVVSSSDLWMYISSTGCLTAGRQNYNNALFPYYTDDKIHESAEITGPKTIIRITEGNRLLVWEPFSNLYCGLYDISRNLYKNTAGNKLIFEEINNDLKIRFSYCWMSSEKLGWIRWCKIENLLDRQIELDVTDGLQNILPYGITRDTQSMMSTLMDAYKVAEWIPEANLALYRMSSIPVDRAEPSEALRTNCIWTHGLNAQTILLSSKQIGKIRFGGKAETEKKIFGQKTSLFINDKFSLAPNEKRDWYFVADLAKDSSEVIALQNLILRETDIKSFIESCITESTNKLIGLVALADGIQQTGDKLNDCRHFANVMFNVMRGGIFENSYSIDVADFLKHLEQSNKSIFKSFENKYLNVIYPTKIEDLLSIAKSCNSNHLLRLTLEYLPLSFSRRHGDPSRPWNFFDINIKNPDGSSSLNYQGNWRDIFQNWEALGFSFPEFLPGMICRFLNASTADGYNPYRITREGFDWEAPEPENPWAYIGYWGDHQIVYLLKLLELYEKFHPGQLFQKFSRPTFVYANVPYRIKSYTKILENPQNTIIFDRELHEKLIHKSIDLGADGKLVSLANNQILGVSFTEKILVSLLTKLSNFVPDAGIWLNTQRPEWNDANNALVGNGASMVTLYHLRRFIKFFLKIVATNPSPYYEISTEVHTFFNGISTTLKQQSPNLHLGFNDTNRKAIVDKLGKSGCDYRANVYEGFSGNTSKVTKEELLDFYGLVLVYIDQSIAANKRDDGLYQSYNLLEFSNNSIKVQNLQLMLEGQAAILSSGFLSITETSNLLQALFQSNLWREDQQSFLLYPFVELPNFLEKNLIAADLVKESLLLQKLLSIGNTQIVKQDENGNYHFNSKFKNVEILKDSLRQLPAEIDQKLIETETSLVCSIYETVFQHRYFTGRSGSFYKYEGLGSIYWHLVSKLLLNLGETIMEFSNYGSNSKDLKQLVDYYYRVKAGIGVHNNPKNYGAFPTDPYSHTPSMMGAQQPGMTGQVKEDILSRFNELGLLVANGEIFVSPILRTCEDFIDKHELNFTYCSTPFTYRNGNSKSIEIFWNDENTKSTVINCHTIPESISKYIFTREAKIARVVVHI